MTSLFGPNRNQVGYEEQPWSVWILGMDDIHDRDTLDECLALANEFNASFAQLRLMPVSEHDPVLYAVVLHHGWAWSRSAITPVCGRPDCQPCATKEAAQ
ncbi:hypothetical protein [Streptomyces sp. CC208A]|uniref:hypothetical protein n=1 Tax=Streptomyces sp. CC208A TaxID=3044573 RepID=UPI0024A8E15E|nr:hypothetical protein [Streptomyces sp. CC208A]